MKSTLFGPEKFAISRGYLQSPSLEDRFQTWQDIFTHKNQMMLNHLDLEELRILLDSFRDLIDCERQGI